jgi:flagella basal body P-ring formation protein FlgA
MRFLLPSLFALVSAASAAAAPAAVPPAAFTSDMLVKALQADLAAHYQFDGSLRLELVRPWSPPDLTASAWQLVVTEYPPIAEPTLYLQCRLVADGSPLPEFSLQLRASVWRDAWVTRQPLINGGALAPGMFEVHGVDGLSERDALPANVDLRSFIAIRQVPAGRVLSWHDISLRPLVRKGEIINVVAEDGMLMVTLKAQALENGAQGDLVTVRNLESLREITGRVVGEDCVAISF